jgi:hypothetical protein
MGFTTNLINHPSFPVWATQQKCRILEIADVRYHSGPCPVHSSTQHHRVPSHWPAACTTHPRLPPVKSYLLFGTVVSKLPMVTSTSSPPTKRSTSLILAKSRPAQCRLSLFRYTTSTKHVIIDTVRLLEACRRIRFECHKVRRERGEDRGRCASWTPKKSASWTRRSDLHLTHRRGSRVGK